MQSAAIFAVNLQSVASRSIKRTLKMMLGRYVRERDGGRRWVDGCSCGGDNETGSQTH